MNIHEHQAKEILREFDIKVPNGVVIFSAEEIKKKVKLLKTEKLVLKAQIHAGGRGKAGGIKIVKSIEELTKQVNNLIGKKLVTHQTGKEGKEVKRLYIEETCDIKKEFYLSCLVDRVSAKIVFISSSAGGVNIEDIAKNSPEKICTTKLEFNNSVNEKDLNSILSPYKLSDKIKKKAFNLIQSIFKILVQKDASQIEINPLVLTKDDDLLCLGAKINFDDNALYKHPDILKLRDISEEDPAETEASKHGLSYIKLNGKIGCMVNGAGLAMATMDIIKLHGSEPANFLDVGGGASKEKVSAAFKIILSDKNVEGILINIFGGIMRCDVLAEGIIAAVEKTDLSIPLVIRLAGTNADLGKNILKKSKLQIIPTNNLEEAAKKIIEVTK